MLDNYESLGYRGPGEMPWSAKKHMMPTEITPGHPNTRHEVNELLQQHASAKPPQMTAGAPSPLGTEGFRTAAEHDAAPLDTVTDLVDIEPTEADREQLADELAQRRKQFDPRQTDPADLGEAMTIREGDTTQSFPATGRRGDPMLTPHLKAYDAGRNSGRGAIQGNSKPPTVARVDWGRKGGGK